MATLVLTAIGDDRPGLVDALAGIITAHRGSWERSEMARLGGKFAGIVRVHVPEDKVQDFSAALRVLGEEGLLHVTLDRADAEPVLDGQRLGISLVGADQPGLVHAVAAGLASLGVTIEELATDTSDAPMAGGLMFEARATVVLPGTVAVDDVQAMLEALAGHLMVDIEITE